MKNLINKLDELAEGTERRKQTKEESWIEDRRWYRDGAWSRMRPLKAKHFVGWHVDALVRRYLSYMPPYRRDRNSLLSYLGIDTIARDGEIVDASGLRRDYVGSFYSVRYYVNAQGVIVKNNKYRNHRSYKSRHAMTHEEIRKRFFENRAQRRKKAREKKEATAINAALVIPYRAWKEANSKERLLNEQKIISHGFDPKTSFRNVPLTT